MSMDSVQQKPMTKKMIVAIASIGGGLEMYDFTIYVFFAPIIAQLFFPHESHVSSLLSTFAIFATGYLVRPIGAILFGHYGDRVGRKKGLLITFIIMAISTTLMGLLPTYAHTGVGVFAPISLFVLRILQGLAVGGDLPGGITFVAEYADPQRRGLMCSFIFFGVNAGLLLASGVAWVLHSTLSVSQLMSWGWRVAFIFSIVLLFVGLYFRVQSIETPLFQKMYAERRNAQVPLLSLFRGHSVQVLQGIGIACLFSIVIAQVFLYMPTYLRVVLHLNTSRAELYNTLNILLFTLLIPFFGYLSDILGRRAMLISTGLFFLFATYPLYVAISHYDHMALLLSMFVMGVFSAAVVATVPTVFSELFPTPVRYTGVGFSYNVGFAIFAGLTPMFATYLIYRLHNSAALSLSLVIGAVLMLIVTLCSKLPARQPLQ